MEARWTRPTDGRTNRLGHIVLFAAWSWWHTPTRPLSFLNQQWTSGPFLSHSGSKEGIFGLWRDYFRQSKAHSDTHQHSQRWLMWQARLLPIHPLTHGHTQTNKQTVTIALPLHTSSGTKWVLTSPFSWGFVSKKVLENPQMSFPVTVDWNFDWGWILRFLNVN